MRSRIIRPQIYTNKDLATCDPEYFRLWTGLWCMADREGRLADDDWRISTQVMPGKAYEITVRGLDFLERIGCIERYLVDGLACIQILKFTHYQKVHVNESPSAFPPRPPHSNKKPAIGAAHGAPKADPGRTNGTPGSSSQEHHGDTSATHMSAEIGAPRHHLQEHLGGPPSGTNDAPKSPLSYSYSTSTSYSSSPRGAPEVDLDPELDDDDDDASHEGETSTDDPTGTGQEPRISAARQLTQRLRALGVSVRSRDPVLQGWLDDGITADQFTEAIGIAREHKPAPASIPAKYLDRVLREPVVNGAATPARTARSGRFDQSMAALDAAMKDAL